MKRRKLKLTNIQYMQLLQEYREYVHTLGYSGSGIKIKYSNVLEFLEWLEEQHINEIADITPANIKSHYEYLKNRPHNKKEGVLNLKTITHHMRSIRVFFSMMQENGIIISNPMSVLKFAYPTQNKAIRTILSIEEIRELYKVAETLQERIILSLGYGCGLRSMELVRMNIADIRFNDNILIVQNGKGNKRRVIPMSNKVKEDIRQYIELERVLYVKNEDEKALILNIKGDRMRKYTCRKILRKIILKTGNANIIEKAISIHNLRHSIATHLLEQGATIEQVRDFLGHSQLETTEIYTRVNQKQLKNLMNTNETANT